MIKQKLGRLQNISESTVQQSTMALLGFEVSSYSHKEVDKSISGTNIVSRNTKWRKQWLPNVICISSSIWYL